MSIALLSLFAAFGAEPPCYGLSRPNTLEGEHFWIEWAEGAADAAQAQVVLAAAEHARAVYTGDLGWAFTDEPVVIEIIGGGDGGISGFAFTVNCDAVPVPRVELTIGEWDPGNAAEVTSHEIGHVAEYAYMGEYTDSVASWLWWMEGNANWLELKATGDDRDWGRASRPYLNNPWIALHQGPTAFLVPERSGHMYGTTFLARYLEEQGGKDAVRATWEWGASRSGTGLFFADAIDGIGMDFDPFWARYLAAMTVGDLEAGEFLTRRVAARNYDELPASGEPEEGKSPEGSGVAAFHFEARTGDGGKALQVAFDGDDEVEWIVVLARTEGDEVGGRVLDYVPFEIEGGEGTAWLSGFDGRYDGWLLASPITRATGPFRLSWEADLIDDPGPMPGTIAFHTDVQEPSTCGCATATPASTLGLFALLPLLRRRRAR